MGTEYLGDYAAGRLQKCCAATDTHGQIIFAVNSLRSEYLRAPHYRSAVVGKRFRHETSPSTIEDYRAAQGIPNARRPRPPSRPNLRAAELLPRRSVGDLVQRRSAAGSEDRRRQREL